MIGTEAGLNITTGKQSTAVGRRAMKGSASITGEGNAAFGDDALLNLTTGQFNVALGTRALNGLTTGTGNVSIGAITASITTGSRNMLIGSGAGTFLPAGAQDNVGACTLWKQQCAGRFQHSHRKQDIL